MQPLPKAQKAAIIIDYESAKFMFNRIVPSRQSNKGAVALFFSVDGKNKGSMIEHNAASVNDTIVAIEQMDEATLSQTAQYNLRVLREARQAFTNKNSPY